MSCTVEENEETGPTAASHKHSGSPTDEEMEDGIQKHHKKTQNILKLSDEDEDNNLVPPPRKSKGRKQSKKKNPQSSTLHPMNKSVKSKSLIKQSHLKMQWSSTHHLKINMKLKEEEHSIKRIQQPLLPQILKKQRKAVRRNLVSDN